MNDTILLIIAFIAIILGIILALISIKKYKWKDYMAEVIVGTLIVLTVIAGISLGLYFSYGKK